MPVACAHPSGLQALRWEHTAWGGLAAGHVTATPAPVFSRLEDPNAEATAAAAAAAPKGGKQQKQPKQPKQPKEKKPAEAAPVQA